MKYIFMAGAPGSKWSSVARNIYFSPSIDRSDNNNQRQYELTGHCGAYWDPGMEFDTPEDLHTLTPLQAQQLWDAPFSGTGVRIVKSHVFCLRKNIDYLRAHWPDSPIVLVHRPDDACVGWWVRSGGFSITYPNYAPYYQDLDTLCRRVAEQNTGLQSAWYFYTGVEPSTNIELADTLGIAWPNEIQNYAQNDIKVKVI
jgi:hypothetical protein